MPVTVVVGGQYGSEGKGKVSHFFAKSEHATIAVRVGGCNSGHTVIDELGNINVFQHLPTSAILPNVLCVLSSGTYINISILLKEIEKTGISKDRLIIDKNAMVISKKDIEFEKNENLRENIGSTGSGTGAAVMRRVLRKEDVKLAKDTSELKRFTCDVPALLRESLNSNERILLEGTQGFGLSLLHTPYYPFATSRDTTAASVVSEVGLSPIDVDQIVLTLRAFPIRVAGNSGPLSNEIDWETVSNDLGSEIPIKEYTTVTNLVRRVARFDSDIVKKAIAINNPTSIVLNHLDYVDLNGPNKKTDAFIKYIEKEIKREVDFKGFGPASLEQ